MGHSHHDHDHETEHGDDGHPHDHHAHHGHGHAHHGHGHHHITPTDHGQAFAIAVALNLGFVGIEAAYAVVAHSTALMADAGHNLSDVLGLLMAWGAAVLARRRPTQRFTYGLRSTSILAALANAALLLVACGAIGWEAVLRFSAPPVVAGTTVAVVAAVGIVVNGVSAWLFMRGSQHDLNIRGAYLHMAADAVVSLGVVVGGVLIVWTGWYWLDAVISLAIVSVIVVGTWGLLKDSVRLALSGVPQHIDSGSVERFLQEVPGVQGIHDLHIWGISTTETAMTAHLVMPEGSSDDGVLRDLVTAMRERFNIHHSTFQVERGTMACECSLTPTTDAASAQADQHLNRST